MNFNSIDETFEKHNTPVDLHPLVSVIIPTYNRSYWVTEAVDSVLSQNYKPFELIVVDDGSTDDTQERLKPYENRLHLIKQQNRGVSAARNRGIQAAKGSLIAFLDSDDLWEKGKLKSQVRYFSENPDTLICQTQEIWIRNGKRVNPMNKHKKPSGMIFEPSLHLCLVSPSAAMIRRQLFDEIGLFDEELPACEDYDLWLRIANKYPIYTTDEPHVIKRGGHDDQLSRAPGLDRYRIRSIEKLLTSGVLSPAQHHEAVTVLIEKCRIYAQGCLKREKCEEAEMFISLMKQYECQIQKEDNHKVNLKGEKESSSSVDKWVGVIEGVEVGDWKVERRAAIEGDSVEDTH